jgi:ubiquinone/menaquinone biosynthesis C-methylase UbiE
MSWRSWFQRKYQETQSMTSNGDDMQQDNQSAQRKFSAQASPVQTHIPYLLPNNIEEVNRLDLQHYILHFLTKSNYFAPISQPDSILDVGCGTGRWASEMAEQFPHARIVGFDQAVPAPLEDIQARYQFQQGSVLQKFNFKDHEFSFVHQRLLCLAIPSSYWPVEIQELVRITQRGGWIETVEADISFQKGGPQSNLLSDWIYRSCKRRGIDPRTSLNLKPVLQQAGLINVKSQAISIPVGKWGGKIGEMGITNMHAIWQAMKAPVISFAGVSGDEYDRVISDVLRECEENHSLLIMHAAYGQRPL